MVKLRRKELGLTQEWVAECVGTTHATIQRLENGKIPLSSKWAIALSKCLKTHPANLMFSKTDLRIALNEENNISTSTPLRRYRKQRGFTQSELAKMAGTSHPQIQRLETGERKLTLEWAETLAPHLLVHPANLLFDDESLYEALIKKETLNNQG
ncbi:MAG: transcriptional regulator with XRE-family HTH domain [Sneathiella sp.]|jgi:transcriptional regulator with XRE-family HTH domain